MQRYHILKSGIRMSMCRTTNAVQGRHSAPLNYVENLPAESSGSRAGGLRPHRSGMAVFDRALHQGTHIDQ